MRTETATRQPWRFFDWFAWICTASILLLIQLLYPSVAFSQKLPSSGVTEPVRLKNGQLSIHAIPADPVSFRTILEPAHFRKKYYGIVQFSGVPDQRTRTAMETAGLRLFDYLPGNAFLAEIPDSLPLTTANNYGITRLTSLPPDYKLGLRLEPKEGELIAVSYFGTQPAGEVRDALTQAGALIVPTRITPERTLFISASPAILRKIASLPFISYLAVQPMKAIPLNYNNRAVNGVDAISAPSGRGLAGEGVTAGIGDNSSPYTHTDFTGRLIDRFPAQVDAHGTHASGTIAGGGILDPTARGMAPHATLVSQYFSDILANAPAYIHDYDMVITNNSYSYYNPGCENEGTYDALSNFVDAQLLTYPTLLHDFAAGNDGFGTCSPYPLQFATVKSGFQCAKNVLTVGNQNAYADNVINSGSSAGPTNDGRLKPEIVAGGTNIYSTFPYDTYGYSSGTSMSTPTVTGALCLLVQRYRQLHGNADPPGALIKAITCNTANDLGNPGPDYIFGFGSLNARSAVETIERNEYLTGTISTGSSQIYTLNSIPSGLRQVRIMLYWPDAPAAPFAASALVNNLDLTVTSPDGTVHHPLVLNPAPNHVYDPAVEGIDNTNNIEQVVIDNPPGGSFTVTVNGTSIPAGPQNFFVTWQPIKPSVIVEYPSGNETWIPYTQEIIRWNAYGGDSNPFTIEYSPDNGSTWSTITSSAPANSRSWYWSTPSQPTSRGLIRVTRNGTSYSDVSHYPFTILGQPALTVTNPCQGYAQLNWSPVNGATGYEVMQLKGDSMSVIASVSATRLLLGNLNRDSTYWFSVRADLGPAYGRRSLAAQVKPAGGSCTLSALDKDLTVDSLIAPLNGRQFTSSQLSNNVAVSVECRNLGTIPSAGPILLSYQVNGGSIVTEALNTAIPAGSAVTYTFTHPIDLSVPGAYNLQIWVDYPGDPQTGNDTLQTTVRQLANAPLTLSPAFTEGFESATPASYESPVKGLDGLDRCDFNYGAPNGRLRTFVNTGFARTGNRCATLDQPHFNANSITDSLITTFNLSGYSATDQIWLDFYYRNHGIDFSLPGNAIWIRGNDQAPWIPVVMLDSGVARIGVYQPSPHIDITGTLSHAVPAQAVSSSFQIKFAEQGYTSANSVITDADLDDGYSFDDITLTRAINDIGASRLITPQPTGACNLSPAQTITVRVRNYSATAATAVPVTYSINGHTVTESIPLINPFDSTDYTFQQKTDMSAFSNYSITAWVSNPGDNYPANDTLAPINIQTVPLISAYPYLEGFENGNGNWYTDGINDSWQWGTPAKTIISKAANGSRCWVTSLTGNYNNSELSYLYSPCFDLSGLTAPVLSFSHVFQTEDDCDCDYHWVEYSTDGVSWIKLGAARSGTNWYDNILKQAWQLSDTIWHVSSYDIPSHGSQVRFRIVMKSDPGTTYEGVGIDDVHIFDKFPVYQGPDMSVTLTQSVSGNGWIHFDAPGGRVLSINPHGQDLGMTTARLYLYPGATRNDGRQYYGNRNIVIQPANIPTDGVAVRFYFPDYEANLLIHGAGCDSCISIHDAYQAGIMQYSTPAPSEEDSILSNDNNGTFHFLQPHREVAIIPNGEGYYAEYSVTGFSEFWINSGLPGNGQPLPLALLRFTAARSGDNALLRWSTLGEKNADHYVIEKSADGAAFLPLDSVPAIRDSATVNDYHLTDYHLWSGVNYYRLKMIASGRSFKYSPIRSVNDTLTRLIVSVYPNPVRTGLLYITTSVNCKNIRLTDVSGRTVLQESAHGYQNSLALGKIAKGIYFVTVLTDAGEQVIKILVL